MRFCITQFPLHAAAKNGNLALLRSLLEKKLNIEEKDDQGWTPLHHAASNGNVDIVQFLVEEMNANVLAEDNCQKTPSDVAFGNAKNYLLHGETPLHIAAEHGRVDEMRRLIKTKADLEVKEHRGWTALHCAARESHMDAVRCLVECGAEVSAKSKHGSTPFDVAYDEDIVKYLVK
eukprot:jgi/Bigna1/143987/aug1.83_g18695